MYHSILRFEIHDSLFRNSKLNPTKQFTNENVQNSTHLAIDYHLQKIIFLTVYILTWDAMLLCLILSNTLIDPYVVLSYCFKPVYIPHWLNHEGE